MRRTLCGKGKGNTYRDENNVITMEIVNDANAIHEAAHAQQIVRGEITGTGKTTMRHNNLYSEEIEAYKRQFAFDRRNVQNHAPSYWKTPKLISDITENWVIGINSNQDGHSGDFIYAKLVMGINYDPKIIMRVLDDAKKNKQK